MTEQKKHLDKDAQDIYKEAPIGLCSFDTNLRYLQINDWLAVYRTRFPWTLNRSTIP